MKYLYALVLVLLSSGGAWAKQATLLADDPVVEQRLIAISEEMRCLVCQNESLAGSRADLAMDLRRELRELIKQPLRRLRALPAAGQTHDVAALGGPVWSDGYWRICTFQVLAPAQRGHGTRSIDR